MPNYIKNRLELIGSPEDIKKLVEQFSTHYAETFSKTHDGDFICEKDENEYGWYNENTKAFTQRGKDPVIGIPKGYKKKVDPAWTRFPDFNKLVPMPVSLSIESSSIGTDMMQVLFGHYENKFAKAFSDISRIQAEYAGMATEELRKHFELGIKYKDNLDKYGYTNWYEWCTANWGTKWNSSECEPVGENVFEFQTAWSGVPDLISKMSSNFPNVQIIYEFADEDTGSNVGQYEFYIGNIKHKNIESGSNAAYELALKLWPYKKEYYKVINGKYEYVEQELTVS